jgi:uncharacterized membrane protein
MQIHYNRIAGQSLERVAALSDGVFAVALTLLVLDLHAPVATAIHSEGELWQALIALAPKVLIYLMSFMTLGIFWVGQQAQLQNVTRSNRDYTWLHLGFLFGISLARIPLGWNHPSDKNTRRFDELENVLIGKVDPLFRDML